MEGKYTKWQQPKPGKSWFLKRERRFSGKKIMVYEREMRTSGKKIMVWEKEMQFSGKENYGL